MAINRACRLALWTVVLQMWLSAASAWRCAAGQAEGVPPVAPDQITVSIDVKDVDVRDVFRALAQQANVNLAVTEAVKGRITLRLQDVRLEKALDAVVRTAGLACRRDGDLTTIMTLPEAESLLKGATEATRPQTRIFTLKSGKAKAAHDAFKAQLTPTGSVSLDEEANSLIVSDVPENLDRLATLADRINAMARPPAPQATRVEARVFGFEFAKAEAAQEAFKASLTSKGTVTLDKEANSLVISDVPENLKNLAELAARVDSAPCQFVIDVFITETVVRDQQDVGVNLKITSSTDSRTTTLATDLIKATGGGGTITCQRTDGQGTTDNFLRALQETENMHILASPRILVLSGKEATIETVEEIPYQELTQTSAGGQMGTVAFKKVGVRLRVTPRLTKDGRITLHIFAEQSAATEVSINNIPVVSTRNADTSLVVNSGEAVVLGGLRRKETTKKVRQVPVLGDIPVLGFLFRSTSISVENRNLLVILIPRTFERSPLGKKEQDALRGAIQPDTLSPRELQEHLAPMVKE